ncbi:GtrA family protein [Roseicella aerolata]|uniref:GtrA family protein n=1 Tax=Roseicella aerolata TaxID=2883479 RepID=A0A9X1IAQ2_9PROT|nr:GtrA family protein [Roseicella aerolata]MCB4821067.1 GtrA family protein [Roseicella aerolata]
MHDMTAAPITESNAVPVWAARLGVERLRLFAQLLRFGVVGVAGFLVDAGVLTLAIFFGLGPWLGRVVSYVVAASTTFTLNRAWTFRGASDAPAMRQWALFLLVNLVGFACNYGTYAVLIALVPLVAANPVLGVAAGSLAGLMGNFILSRRFVFGQGGKGRPSRN